MNEVTQGRVHTERSGGDGFDLQVAQQRNCLQGLPQSHLHIVVRHKHKRSHKQNVALKVLAAPDFNTRQPPLVAESKLRHPVPANRVPKSGRNQGAHLIACKTKRGGTGFD